MSKLRNVNIKNLIYLTGLKETLVFPCAKVLDNILEKMKSNANEEAKAFIEWRNSANFNNFSHKNVNFSFRIYQWANSEGKIATLCGVDKTATSGGYGMARRGAYLYYYLATPEGQEIISIPLVYVLRENGPIEGKYVVYEHGAIDYSVTGKDLIEKWVSEVVRKSNDIYVPMPAEPHGSNGLIYIGITSRSWAVRYREHVAKSKSGSNLPFHKAIRNEFNNYNTRFHYVLLVVHNRDEADSAEEQFVESRSLFPKGLNAIPGGKAGIRYLASINALRPKNTNKEEFIEDLLSDILSNLTEVESNPSLKKLTQLPSHLLCGEKMEERSEMVEFWSDDSNAARMITSRTDRLSIEQIREARYSAARGFNAEEICDQIGARNVDIVKRLLDGKTYRRVLE